MAARQRALDKKALNEAEKQAKEEVRAEAERAKEWSIGAKDATKAKAKEDAEMAKLKKKQEMQALLAEDAAAVASSPAGKVTKKKGADKDLELFKAALSAQPKSKAEKEKEKKEKEKALKRQKEEEAAKLKLDKAEVRKATSSTVLLLWLID